MTHEQLPGSQTGAIFPNQTVELSWTGDVVCHSHQSLPFGEGHLMSPFPHHHCSAGIRMQAANVLLMSVKWRLTPGAVPEK